MTRLAQVISRSSPPRKWVTALVLLAFFLQSLAIQTHVHPNFAPTAVKAVALGETGPAPIKTQDPLDQCRLCQEMVHAGSFFTPSVVALAVSLSFTAATFAVLRAPPHNSATAFSWQSRAPPRR
jgi:hypothetical protein